MVIRSISLSVVVPALNEEITLNDTIKGICKALYDSNIDWEIILVNDGSTDRTQDIADRLANAESRIKVIRHQRPMGIGCCFREGLEVSTKDAITWLPADGENDPNEVFKYLSLLEQVDIVNPFVLNVGIRSWGRRILSTIYLWIINFSFGTMFNYTNGNVIYRRKVFEIIKPKSNGFFFQTECLIKAVRAGFIFAEVPVHLGKRKQGCSKALTIDSLCRVFLEFIKLFLIIRIFRTAERVPQHCKL